MSKPSRTFGERHHRYTIATARVDVAVPSDADSMSLEELELRGPHTSVTAAHNHFAALQIEPDKWAITPNLVGSHCVALTDADLGVLAGHGGSMVWSPAVEPAALRRATAHVKAALARAFSGRPRIGLGNVG